MPTMLVLVFRKKNSGVDVELGFAFSLRQATVGRPHTLEECISGHCFIFISPVGAKK